MEPEIHARIKPLNCKYENCLTKINKDLILNLPDNNKFGTNRTLTYSFNKIFDETSNQLDLINETCNKSVEDLFNGINSLLVVYGANNSGKNYTIYGNDEDNGILQASLYHLFQLIETYKSDATLRNSDSDESVYKKVPASNWHQRVPYENSKKSPFSVHVSYVGLINDEFIDLLDSDKKTKKFNEVEIESTDDAINLIRMGLGQTDMSMGHKVLTIKLCERNQGYRKLTIVDLAYQDKSLTQRELEFVKSSLMALRNCFEIIKEKKSNPPYKQSKLTWLLKNYFKHESKIKMILCLNPSVDEFNNTCNVLKFSSLKNSYECNNTSTPKNSTQPPFLIGDYEKLSESGDVYEELDVEIHKRELEKLVQNLSEFQKKVENFKPDEVFYKKLNEINLEIERFLGKESRRKSSANETESFTRVSTLRTMERCSIEPEPSIIQRSQSVRCDKNVDLTPRIRKISNQIRSTLRLSRNENFDFHNGFPVGNRRGQKRSKSVEVWLDHRPQNLAKLDTLMQPMMSKKNSVKKIELKDTKRSSKYVLTHQQQDEYGEVVTSLIKGDIIKSPTGGSSVIFTDIERLQLKSPQLIRPQKNKSVSIEKNPFIIEDRCGFGIEGHPRLCRNRTFR